MMSRRDIGSGVVENSMPRTNVRRFQGGVVRESFSSQMPIQGKSERWRRYPTARSSLGLAAVNQARSEGVSKSCAVKLEARPSGGGNLIASFVAVADAPWGRGARGQTNPPPRYSCASAQKSPG